MADDFQRLLAGDRRAHRVLDILGVAYFEGVHETIYLLSSSSAKADDPVVANAKDKFRRRGILDTLHARSMTTGK